MATNLVYGDTQGRFCGVAPATQKRLGCPSADSRVVPVFGSLTQGFSQSLGSARCSPSVSPHSPVQVSPVPCPRVGSGVALRMSWAGWL